MGELESEVKSKIQELEEDMLEIQSSILEVAKGINLNEIGGRKAWRIESDTVNVIDALANYERWYNASYPLIAEYLPDRLDEFRERYEAIRSGLELDFDYIRENDIDNVGTLRSRMLTGMVFQTNLLNSIPARVESESLKAKRAISGDIVSTEVQKAKELFDEGHVRAAGVIGGVALERHLLTLCESAEQELGFDRMYGITNLATTLSSASEISDDDQRLLEYLAGIRNKCSHASDKGPEKREVERMLNDIDEFIRS